MVGVGGIVALLLCAVPFGGFSDGSQWVYALITIVISILIWLEVFSSHENTDSIVKRKRFRMAIIAHNLSCIACSLVLFYELILSYRHNDFTAREILRKRQKIGV